MRSHSWCRGEFHEAFAAEPFRCVHSGTDFGPKALDEHADYVARWGMPLGGGLLLRLYFGVFTIPHLDEMFGAIDDEIAEADLLFSHPAASVVGAMACERRGVPWVVGDLFPMLVPTAAAPPAGVPNLGPRGSIGPSGGRLAHHSSTASPSVAISRPTAGAWVFRHRTVGT